MSNHRTGLGAEHPRCDSLQIILLILFFGVWSLDFLSFFFFGYSTVLIGLFPLPLGIILSIASLGLGLYLVAKSHNVIFEEVDNPSKLIDFGVYSRVRHPMYLGTLLFCLGFSFMTFSLLSFVVLCGFFIFFDRMATYEEKDLIKKLGQEYVDYKKRVPKWLPRS